MNKIFHAVALASFFVLAGCSQSANDNTATPAAGSVDASRASGTVVIDMKTQDGKTPTVVGHVVDGQGLASTGKAGQLMFGPYSAMAAGTYKVIVYGQFDGNQPATPLVLDVAYAQGASVAKSVDVQPADAANGTLATFEFTLPQQVTDLEVRARVADGAHVTIKGYQVIVK